MTDAARRAARREVAAMRAGSGQKIDEDRLWANLLSSQPLAFSLFADLAHDLDLATRVLRRLWPERVARVTRVEFEYSPGLRHGPASSATATWAGRRSRRLIRSALPSALGRFVWNQAKYVRVPGRKNRRRVERPESEWITREYPELAIVPKDLWDEAQARFRRVHESLAKLRWSDALASKLRDEEALLGQPKAERSARAKDTDVRVVPHPTAIAGYLKSLFALLETDPVRGREILSRFVSPIVMTPEVGPQPPLSGDRAFNLSFFLGAPSPVLERLVARGRYAGWTTRYCWRSSGGSWRELVGWQVEHHLYAHPRPPTEGPGLILASA